ncbi:MAG: hypothetical protein PHW75_03430 [Patescibacteria group bacterium]|nr:hypothetical protein [Patescibacteria group bacterium]
MAMTLQVVAMILSGEPTEIPQFGIIAPLMLPFVSAIAYITYKDIVEHFEESTKVEGAEVAPAG